MAEFKLTVGDDTYTFAPEMVTVNMLREVKKWYGRELGRYNSFIEAFFEGDPEAALCAVWIARKAAGESNPPEPNQMENFSLASWIGVGDTVEDKPEGNPTRDTAPPTPGTTETPTNSEDDTSGKSPTSSDGPSKQSKTSGGSTS